MVWVHLSKATMTLTVNMTRSGFRSDAALEHGVLEKLYLLCEYWKSRVFSYLCWWMSLKCKPTKVTVNSISPPWILRKVLLEVNRLMISYEVEQWYVRHNYFIVLYHRLHVLTYIQVIVRLSFTGKSIKCCTCWDPLMLTEVKYIRT
jgi:hypothetical protein